jgi:hypothetical protein
MMQFQYTSKLAEIRTRAHIGDAWLALGGEKLRGRRGRAFWRNGDGFSVSLNLERGLWFDFVAGDGGDILDLVRRVRGGTRADALRWLGALTGVPLDQKPLSRLQKRQYAALRDQAEDLAQQCTWWANALIQELEQIKAQAYERGDFATVYWSSQELYLMEHAAPPVLMDRFRKAQRANAADTATLVEAGREDEEHAYLVCSAVIFMLSKAQESAHAA